MNPARFYKLSKAYIEMTTPKKEEKEVSLLDYFGGQ